MSLYLRHHFSLTSGVPYSNIVYINVTLFATPLQSDFFVNHRKRKQSIHLQINFLSRHYSFYYNASRIR